MNENICMANLNDQIYKLTGKAIGSLETILILMQKLDSVYFVCSHQNAN